ncbi:MAG: Hint domain-containing protein [Litoreibacter sp.]
MMYPVTAERLRNDPSSGRGNTSPAPVKRFSDRGPLPRARTPNRPFSISWRTPSGAVSHDTVFAPAVPVVEATCSSLARGVQVSTTEGQVSIEDLVPGMYVNTVEYGPLMLQWVGSYDMSPREVQNNERACLYRVNSDTFGYSKPSHDVVLAPRAHILLRDAACKRMYGTQTAFAPIRAFEDGMSVVAVSPMSPVTLFNLAFDRQATIIAGGLEVESYHPGPYSMSLMDDDMTYSLLRLFPHVRNLAAFGEQSTERLTAFEVKALREGA